MNNPPVLSCGVVFLDLGETLVTIKPSLHEDTARRIVVESGYTANDFHDLGRIVVTLKQAINHEWASRVNEDFQWVQTREEEHKYWREFYQSVTSARSPTTPEYLRGIAATAPDSGADLSGSSAILS